MDKIVRVIIEFITALAMSLSYGFMITYLVLWGRAMPEHAYFMLLFVSAFSTVISLLIALGMHLYHYLSGAPHYQQLFRPLNRTYFRFPIPQLIGFLLMVNYVLAGFGSPHVSGILQAVLTQGSIPFTIVMSYLLLRRRYIWLQLLGATVVIGGALLSMEKDLTGSGSCKSSANASDFEMLCYDVNAKLNATNATSVCVGESNSILWDFLYFISTLPMGLVNIIMEYFLQYSKGDEARRNKAGELNIPIAVAINNIWLFIWLLLFFWLNLVPEVVPRCAGVEHSVQVFGDNMRKSLECTFTGKGGYSNDTNSGLVSGLHNVDDCDHAASFVIMLALAATVQMILQAYTVQQQSATFTMALVTLGPMFAVFFENSEGITTSTYYSEVKTEFSGFMTGGLIIVLLGILMYKVPEVLRFFGVAHALHPVETDDSDSWIHRILSRILRRNERKALETIGDVNSDTRPLNSHADDGEVSGCCG